MKDPVSAEEEAFPGTELISEEEESFPLPESTVEEEIFPESIDEEAYQEEEQDCF